MVGACKENYCVDLKRNEKVIYQHYWPLVHSKKEWTSILLKEILRISKEIIKNIFSYCYNQELLHSHIHVCDSYKYDCTY
jgi:hypothetical protein